VVRINGGFSRSAGDLRSHADGEDLVLEPFDRLMAKRGCSRSVRRLLAQHGHLQGRQDLEELWSHGSPPWTRTGK